jgi:hypothetical protein
MRYCPLVQYGETDDRQPLFIDDCWWMKGPPPGAGRLSLRGRLLHRHRDIDRAAHRAMIVGELVDDRRVDPARPACRCPFT